MSRSVQSSKRSDRYSSAATHEAQRSAQRFRHGAVLVKGGKILGAGHNAIRTGFAGPLAEAAPVAGAGGVGVGVGGAAKARKGEGFSMHAEMAAISNALRGARPAAFKVSSLPCSLSLSESLTPLSQSNFDAHRYEPSASAPQQQQQGTLDARLLASYLSLKDLARREQTQQPRLSLLSSACASDVSSSDADEASSSTSSSTHAPQRRFDARQHATLRPQATWRFKSRPGQPQVAKPHARPLQRSALRHVVAA